MSNIVKYDTTELLDNAIRGKAQNFHTILNRNPSKDETKVNAHANNSSYLPISFIEMTMDEMFFGLWSTKNFQSKVIINEIVGELEIHYFHPVHKVWLSRVGAAGVQIQQSKGASIDDITKKIKNTLQKDYPHLKADCFRNACLSIGKQFGRDLNREFEDQFQPILKVDTEVEEAKMKLIEALEIYQGEDKEDIRSIIQDKIKAKEFTMKFAEDVAKQIGIEL